MVIEVKDVSKSFRKVPVLEHISLKFESGNIYGLYGRNGAGKSVFLKLLCGFYVPTSGQILFDGKDYNANLMFPDSLRALIEKPSFFPELSGYANLKLLADIQKRIGDTEILQALSIVELIEDKDKKYDEYSLGMKQKLGIAQAIMEDPEILILDEPFNGIEHKTVLKLIDYLILEKKKNKIIIISTHIKEDLEKLTDKIYYFDAGHICETLDDEEIKE